MDELELLRTWRPNMTDGSDVELVRARTRVSLMQEMKTAVPQQRRTAAHPAHRWRLPYRRGAALIAAVGLVAAGGLAAVAALRATVAPDNGVITRPKFNATRELSGAQLAKALDIATFRWETGEDGEERLIVGPHADPELAHCGSGRFEGSMLVLTDGGTAYCILGVDTENPESEFAARAIASRLINEDVLTDNELEIIRLQSLLKAIDPSNPEAAVIRQQREQLIENLTPDERRRFEG